MKTITMTKEDAFEKFPYAVAADGDYVVTLCESKKIQQQVLLDWREENEDAYSVGSGIYLGPSCGLNRTLKYKDADGNDITITEERSPMISL